jgi:hypothetical protein
VGVKDVTVHLKCSEVKKAAAAERCIMHVGPEVGNNAKMAEVVFVDNDFQRNGAKTIFTSNCISDYCRWILWTTRMLNFNVSAASY